MINVESMFPNLFITIYRKKGILKQEALHVRPLNVIMKLNLLVVCQKVELYKALLKIF